MECVIGFDKLNNKKYQHTFFFPCLYCFIIFLFSVCACYYFSMHVDEFFYFFSLKQENLVFHIMFQRSFSVSWFQFLLSVPTTTISGYSYLIMPLIFMTGKTASIQSFLYPIVFLWNFVTFIILWSILYHWSWEIHWLLSLSLSFIGSATIYLIFLFPILCFLLHSFR